MKDRSNESIAIHAQLLKQSEKDIADILDRLEIDSGRLLMVRSVNVRRIDVGGFGEEPEAILSVDIDVQLKPRKQ